VSQSACEWCEYLSVIADLTGFVGALFLAYPFLRGQRTRDEAAAIGPERVPDLKDAAVFADVKAEMESDILNRVHGEYRAAKIGTVMIALAFLGKLISALPNIL
jgi:hypothetical protein